MLTGLLFLPGAAVKPRPRTGQQAPGCPSPPWTVLHVLQNRGVGNTRVPLLSPGICAGQPHHGSAPGLPVQGGSDYDTRSCPHSTASSTRPLVPAGRPRGGGQSEGHRGLKEAAFRPGPSSRAVLPTECNLLGRADQLPWREPFRPGDRRNLKQNGLIRSLGVETGSQVAQVIKNLPASAGDMGSIPKSGRSPGEGEQQPTPVSWRIPWTEEPGGLQSVGSPRIRQLKPLSTQAHIY